MPALIDKYIDKNRFDVEIKFTEYAGHASVLAKEAREAGIDVVVAVGGDGTINEVARALTQSKTALGIIPCGSGNGLARHLMLPLNIKGALEVINNCEIHDLDYGIIDGHPFFCTCGMGFDAFISAKFAEAGKRGPITYAENILKEGLTYKSETYTLTLDDAEISYKAFLVSCANASQYGNEAYIAPQASMKDGLIDVVIIEPFDIIEAPSISLEMFNKTLDKNSKIKSFKTRKLHVHREQPGFIHYDGDPIEAPADLDIELVHQGIRIVVNPNADKRRRRPNRVQSAFSNFINELQNVKNGMEHLTTEMGQQVGNPVRQAKAVSEYIQSKLK